MQRRSQGDGRGRRGTIQNRQPPLDDSTLRGMNLLGPLFSDGRQGMIIALSGAPNEYACPLPISTRGIGFAISRLIPRLRRQLPEYADTMPDAGTIYRASLAQLHEKMDQARAVPLEFPLQTDTPLYDAWPSSFAIDRPLWILQSNNINISQIAMLINSIGNFEFKNKKYGPVFMKDASPLNLQITNLREYCMDMSSIETDPVKRMLGFELNSIPNAIWERLDNNDPKSIILTNPDDVIQPNYSHDSLSRDLIKLHKWIDDVRKKMPDIRGEIDYKSDGDLAILVSTHVVPGRSMKIDNNVFTGDESIFWSRESIDHDAWCIGIFSLVGEVLHPMDGGHRSNIGGSRCCCSWASITDMIL